MTHRAYSTLDIKAASDSNGKRTFSGIASTPNADRTGDIVEPDGATFELPMSFLWQHDSKAPIGWITAAKISEAGIEVDGEIASTDEPGNLKNRLDEAWQSMRMKLVRGLSIGFKPLEYTLIKETYSYRYVKWLWLELSAVTIPMNGDCSITAIKSADQAILRTATGAPRLLRLDAAPALKGKQFPGDSGQQAARKKGVLYLY